MVAYLATSSALPSFLSAKVMWAWARVPAANGPTALPTIVLSAPGCKTTSILVPSEMIVNTPVAPAVV